MTSVSNVIMESASGAGKDPEFPHAPADWSRELAMKTAQQTGLKLSENHWQAVRALQEYYARHEQAFINTRELHDALDEKFHGKGGMKYLYQLFPAGPVAQGCQIAGLKAPAGAVDKGFGSVV
jgi:TusE/DsrC/DsvC family sulfur relay protein